MIHIRWRISKWIALSVLFAACTATAQRGALTAPRNLSHLSRQSGLILRGRVTAAHVELHPTLRSLRTVVVTLRTDEVLKGRAGTTYTFRQVIWDVRDVQDNAGYRKGQHWLLFLNTPNHHGLTSPVGLEQGRFKVTARRDGNLEVINGRGNIGLFEGLTETPAFPSKALSSRAQSLVSTHTRGSVMLDSLREVIHSLAGGQQ